MHRAQNGYQPPAQSSGYSGQRQQPQQPNQPPYQNAPPQQQQRATQAPFSGFKLAGATPPPQQPQQRRPAKKWTMAQLRASDAIIPLQSGTNQFASQAGMTGFGTPRNTTTVVYGGDVEAELEPNRPPDAVIPLQYGTNQYASQRGMTGFGQPRDVTGKHYHRLYEEDPAFIPDQGPYQQ